MSRGPNGRREVVRTRWGRACRRGKDGPGQDGLVAGTWAANDGNGSASRIVRARTPDVTVGSERSRWTVFRVKRSYSLVPATSSMLTTSNLPCPWLRAAPMPCTLACTRVCAISSSLILSATFETLAIMM